MRKHAAWLALGVLLGCSAESGGGSGGAGGAPPGDDRGVHLGDGPVDATTRDAVTDGPPLWGPEAGRDAAPPDAASDAALPDAASDAALPDAAPPQCRTDADCDDGLFCDGVERCSNGRCYASPTTPCEDGVACTREVCDEEADTCSVEPDDTLCPADYECDRKVGCFHVQRCQADADCDDGLPCDGVETCVDQRCRPGLPTSCDDQVDCTLDVCVDDTGTCEHVPIHARCVETELCDATRGCTDRPPCQRDDDCDDASFCNGVERCDVASGRCVPGEPPPVGDQVDCTLDVCSDARAQVLHQPSPARCSDGLFCDGAEVCHPVQGCVPGEPPALSDGVACTVDRCDEDHDFVEHVPDDTRCDDGLFCNGAEACHPVDDCQPGEPPVLSDGVGCTVDTCSELEHRVVHTPVDEACDDHLFCDGAERCDAAQDCVHGAPPVLDDGVGCTDDSCDEANDRVVHAPVDAACDDHRLCDGVETCDPARGCQPGTPPPVDDGIPCTVDRCDDASNRIVHEADDTQCDDHLFCDGDETCDPLRGCRTGTPPALDDGVGCTDDICDEASGRVVHIPDNGHCDDHLFCDGVELCDARRDCQRGTPPSLDDGVDCTIDRCDEAHGTITHTPDHARCGDGQVCDGEEFCDAQRGCQSGAPPADGTVCQPNPRSICLDSACAASTCGDHFVDHGAGEQCERGDANCDANCHTIGGGGTPAYYTGTFNASPPFGYTCHDLFIGMAVVNFNVMTFVFSVANGTLTVTGAPQRMTQTPAPVDANFSVSGTLSGGCDEIYSLAGSFTDDDHWTGVFTVTFNGDECGFTDCSFQQFQVSGTRR